MQKLIWQHDNGRAQRLFVGLMLAFISATFLGTGCGEIDQPTYEADPSITKNIFLTAEEFEGLRQGGALVIDVRSANTVRDGHIPGAVNAPWKTFAEPERNGILLEDENALEEAARSIGIKNDVPVIIYGDGGTGDSSAGRMYWTLEYLGHSNVALLDGGFDAWKSLNLQIASGDPATPSAGDFEINVRPEIRATADEVEAAIENDTLLLVDTRTMDEWMGKMAEDGETDTRGNPRGGYIPTAIHYHWENVIDEATGKLRPKEDIRAELEELGIVPGVLTIPYCQSGVRSGFFYAVLKWLDYPNPQNYDGSWWEWSRGEDFPLGEYE